MVTETDHVIFLLLLLQMDTIYSLVEVSGKICNNLKTTTLSTFANNLTISKLRSMHRSKW